MNDRTSCLDFVESGGTHISDDSEVRLACQNPNPTRTAMTKAKTKRGNGSPEGDGADHRKGVGLEQQPAESRALE